MNDRNGQNQFRRKPKFRPSWPKIWPKVRLKFYQKLHENEEVFSNFILFYIWTYLVIKTQMNWDNLTITLIFFCQKRNYFSEKFWRNGQKLAKISSQCRFFCNFGISAGWPKDSAEIFRPSWQKFRPKFRFRSYTSHHVSLWVTLYFTESPYISLSHPVTLWVTLYLTESTCCSLSHSISL